MPGPSVRIAVDIPEKLDEMLATAARARGKFKSRLVKELIAEWLVKNGSVSTSKPTPQRSAYATLFETPTEEKL